MQNGILELAEELTKAGFTNLFLSYSDERMDELWERNEGPKKIFELSLNEGVNVEARFLAAEILFRKGKSFSKDSQKKRIAKVYAAILSNDLSVNANIWGMPGLEDGETGKHVLSLGRSIKEPFKPLLDNDALLYYEGSEEATVGNEHQYRVKDFAAYFLSIVLDLSYEAIKEPKQRDVEIGHLKKLL